MSDEPRLIAEAIGLAGRLPPLDLTLRAGEFTVLVGPNGAGKTSLLHALAGVGGASGIVKIDGKRLDDLSPAQRFPLLALLAADREVRWPLVVADFVALGLGPKSERSAVEIALGAVNAGHLITHRIDRLSTGERARVMLARALVGKPAVLLLDEPAAHLDPAGRIEVITRLKAEAQRGAAVLASLHDLSLARHLAARVIVMERGRIIEDGAPREALSDAVVARLFEVQWNSETGWVRA